MRCRAFAARMAENWSGGASDALGVGGCKDASEMAKMMARITPLNRTARTTGSPRKSRLPHMRAMLRPQTSQEAKFKEKLPHKAQNRALHPAPRVLASIPVTA